MARKTFPKLWLGDGAGERESLETPFLPLSRFLPRLFKGVHDRARINQRATKVTHRGSRIVVRIEVVLRHSEPSERKSKLRPADCRHCTGYRKENSLLS